MKTRAELTELYHQVKDNYYLIKYLSESDTEHLISEINRSLDKFIYDHPEDCREYSFYNEHISLLVDLKKHLEKNPESELKEYDSLNRARAFYIMKMHQDNKITDDTMTSKKRLIPLIDKEFPEQSKTTSKQIHDLLKYEGIFNNFEQQRADYSLDYEYGLKLYRLKYPDT